MKNTNQKKSLADFSKNAMISTDQLLKIKGGGDGMIIIENPLP